MKQYITDQELFDSTLDLLRFRIRRKGDFPSLGKSIQRIQESMRCDLATDDQLVEAILSDVALTQKTLRLANSAMYASFGTKVSTVTEALHVLGTETVGHLAMSLKLIDQLESAASTATAKGELSRSAATGMVSRKIAATVSGMDGEEAAVAALLNRLGWLLVNFYLPEQANVIRKKTSGGVETAKSESATLGAPAWVFGQALGTEWGLPEALVRTMNPVPDTTDEHATWVASVCAFSREFVDATSDGKDTSELVSKYAGRIGCEPDVLHCAAQEVAQSEEAKAFVKVAAESAEEANKVAKPNDAGHRLDDALRGLLQAADSLRVDQVVSMATELVHGSMGFNRTFFFLRNAADKSFKVKIALGATNVDSHSHAFAEAFSPDVFHLALSNRKSVFIANAQEGGIRKRLPPWYLSAYPSVKSFLLLPLCVGSHSVGLLYADWGDNTNNSTVDSSDLTRLEAIRACMVSAFERLTSSAVQKKAA